MLTIKYTVSISKILTESIENVGEQKNSIHCLYKQMQQDKCNFSCNLFRIFRRKKRHYNICVLHLNKKHILYIITHFRSIPRSVRYFVKKFDVKYKRFLQKKETF